ANSKSSEADVAYEIADDVKALVEPIENPMIATARQRASIYGGSAEMVRVPGVGLTLSAYFPDLRLIAEHPEQ
ncbi:MAG: hypothetical protein RL670_1309, partial [Actinomycetota bacterium]